MRNFQKIIIEENLLIRGALTLIFAGILTFLFAIPVFIILEKYFRDYFISNIGRHIELVIFVLIHIPSLFLSNFLLTRLKRNKVNLENFLTSKTPLLMLHIHKILLGLILIISFYFPIPISFRYLELPEVLTNIVLNEAIILLLAHFLDLSSKTISNLLKNFLNMAGLIVIIIYANFVRDIFMSK